MRLLQLFTLIIALTACNQSNEPFLSDQPPGEVESKDNAELIQSINGRLHSALGSETVERMTEDHAYIFALNNDNEELELYYELGYDSEGWPMAGYIYYFYEKKLIGFAYVTCDGCVGQDVSNKLKSLPIKKYKSEEELKDWDIIWIIEEPNEELGSKAIEIQNNFNSNKNNYNNGISYGELRGRIIGGNLRMLEREMGKPTSYNIATGFIENNFQMKLPIWLFDKCLTYEVYVYENYLGDGENILVTIDNNKKVSNVIIQSQVQDAEDICCCN